MANRSQPLAYTYNGNPVPVSADGTYVSYSPGTSGWAMQGPGWSPASGEPFWASGTGNWWMSPIYDDDVKNTGTSKYTRIIGVGGQKNEREFAPGTLTWLHDQTNGASGLWGNNLVNWTAATAQAGTIVTNTGCFDRNTASIGVTTLLGMGPIVGVADGGPFGHSEWPITQGATGSWAGGLVGTKIWPQGVGGDPLYEPGTIPAPFGMNSVKGKKCLFTVTAATQVFSGAVDPTTSKVFDGYRLDVTWDATSDPGECGNGPWGGGSGIMSNQFVSIINISPYTATIQGNANFHFYGVEKRLFPSEADSLLETARLAVHLGIPTALVTDTYAQIKTKAQATVGFWTSW